jgi:hypothetical protein
MPDHHPHPTSTPVGDLHLCVACARPFVVPSEILEVLHGPCYRVELRCNDCGWTSTDVFDEPTMERLDRELDRTQAQIVTALAVLEETRLLEEADAFAAALHADLILPEDF